MDHGYAVDVAHLLFTAGADFARYATPAPPWNRAASRPNGTMGFSPRDLRVETIVECARPYNRNRASLNRARVYTTRLAGSSHLEATNHFYGGRSRAAK